MEIPQPLNIFTRTRYSLSEEDRVVNGLLLLLQYCPPSLPRAFLDFSGTPADHWDALVIRDHVPYARDSVVDGELLVPGNLLLAIEAKIYRNQFESPEQAERYLRLLQERKEPRRVLLLLSPDDVEPAPVSLISGQSPSCHITWRSWGDCYRLLEREQSGVDASTEPARFLVNQYLEYLDALGLRARDAAWAQNNQRLEPRLHFLLGNVAAEKIILHLNHHGGGHVSGIARDHALGMGATARVLDRFLRAGLIRKESRGRVVWYTLDGQSPFAEPLLEMLRLVYESVPEPLRKATFDPTYALDE